MAKTSRTDFEALVRRAGITLTPAQADHIYEGWGFVEPMFDRIRTHGRGREAEPAHIFRADAYFPATQDTDAA